MPHQIYKLRPKKRTKIVATIGPASDSEDVIRQMVYAGLNVIRVNFSHSKPEYLNPVVARIRQVGEELNFPLAILGDLRGPRMRVGEVENGEIELPTDSMTRLTPEVVVGTPELITVSFQGLSNNVWPGNHILLDDGNLELTVEKPEDDGSVLCKITRGGKLSSNRGINLPGIKVDLPALSEKDFSDIHYAIEKDFDFLAMSFVQSADDVRLLKAYLSARQADIAVISKIEKRSALDDIETIVKESYGVMVARGDLALEMSIREIPIAQKRIIAACRKTATPVITATQMLESMTYIHKPTRAEATDVANAVLDGTDALMLSGETAIGKFPVETIQTMSTIAGRAEEAWMTGELPPPPEFEPENGIAPHVSYASHLLSKSVGAKVLTTYTTSGATARRVSSHRPPIPIFAFTSSVKTHRRMGLTWGVRSLMVERMHNTDKMVDFALRQARESGLAGPNDIAIMTGSARPHGVSGRTNSLRVERIPGD